MAYASAKNIDPNTIPVIDVAPLFDGPEGERHVGRQLRETVERIGFFYIENHRVPQDLIDEVLAVAERFFHASLESKESVRVRTHHRGFLPIGEAAMSGARNPDYKESFVWGWPVSPDDPDIAPSGGVLAANRWPEFLPDMAGVLTTYLGAVNGLGVRLLRAFAAGLGIEHDRFVSAFDKPLTRGAIIYYPPQPEDMGETQFGVAPHTDYGCITLLYQDGAGGLQVKNRGGDWLTAHPIPGTFVVNVGDLLHRWSNDRFLSNPHRVVNISGRERFSVPVFVDPNWDTVIEPVVTGEGAKTGDEAKYPPVTCADYIRAIYEKSFAYREPPTD